MQFDLSDANPNSSIIYCTAQFYFTSSSLFGSDISVATPFAYSALVLANCEVVSLINSSFKNLNHTGGSNGVYIGYVPQSSSSYSLNNKINKNTGTNKRNYKHSVSNAEDITISGCIFDKMVFYYLFVD
jgi:hypothetical protein